MSTPLDKLSTKNIGILRVVDKMSTLGSIFMELPAAKKLTEYLIKKHSLEGWYFVFSESKEAFGDCTERIKRIRLSRPLTLINDDSTVYNVILHEIAHGLAGHKAGHGEKWKAVAVSIGCTGDRCYTTDDVNTPILAWQGVCGQCYTVYNAHRQPKAFHYCLHCHDAFRQKSRIAYFPSWQKKYYPLQATSKSGEIYQATMRIGKPTVGRIYLTEWVHCQLEENPHRLVVAPEHVPLQILKTRPEIRGKCIMLLLTPRSQIGYEYAKAVAFPAA